MVSKRISQSDNVIYSTNPEFEFEYENLEEPETLIPKNQELFVSLAKRKPDGSMVTSVSGFTGRRMDLLTLEQELMEVCRTSGSARMYEIILHRDVRKRAYVYLRNQGYKVHFKDS